MGAILVSMLAGKAIALYFSPGIASHIGGVTLILVGLWMITGIFRDSNGKQAVENPTIAVLSIKPMGIIIQILRQPARADLDESGVINYREASFLGIALALDGLGAGIGASMAGFSLGITTLMVGLCEFWMVNAGLKMGTKLERSLFKEYTSVVSGLVLCLLGVSRIC
jgi:putative sporulation protein YtaF